MKIGKIWSTQKAADLIDCFEIDFDANELVLYKDVKRKLEI